MSARNLVLGVGIQGTKAWSELLSTLTVNLLSPLHSHFMFANLGDAQSTYHELRPISQSIH